MLTCPRAIMRCASATDSRSANIYWLFEGALCGPENRADRGLSAARAGICRGFYG